MNSLNEIKDKNERFNSRIINSSRNNYRSSGYHTIMNQFK